MEKFQTNSEIHSISTRHKPDLRMPNADQQGAYCCAGFKLPCAVQASIKCSIHDVKVFKPAVKYYVEEEFTSVEND